MLLKDLLLKRFFSNVFLFFIVRIEFFFSKCNELIFFSLFILFFKYFERCVNRMKGFL